MAFIFTHLIIVWGITKVYEFLAKKELSKYTWLFLLAGAIFPDLDLIIDWVFGLDIHRTITHSLPFAILFPAFVYIILRLVKDKNCKKFSIALGIGIMIHILIDMNSSFGVTLLWPSNLYFSFTRIGLLPNQTTFFQRPAETILFFLKRSLFDAALGVAWIFYLGLQRRIKF
jgi:membrane-bound metal-dependent hydrolase YbcI (DUF457 family)